MALISCSECEKQISNLAPACPHCGAPRHVAEESPRKQRRRDKPVDGQGKAERAGAPAAPMSQAKMNMIAVLAAVVAFPALIGFMICSSSKSTPEAKPDMPVLARDVPDQPAPRPVRPTAPVAKSYEKVDRATMQDEYKNNEVRADATYKGHLVEISGVAGKIDKGPFGGVYISVGSGARFDMEAVRCTVDENDKAQIAAIMAVNKGDRVTVHGRVLGYTVMSVSLKDCALVE